MNGYGIALRFLRIKKKQNGTKIKKKKLTQTVLTLSVNYCRGIMDLR